MSQQMNQAKETVEKIIAHLDRGSYPLKMVYLEQLKTIDKLIVQNQAKIWLRTRSGKPMAEKLEATAIKTLHELESGSLDEVDELFEAAKEIDEESQRRSMVVT